MIYQDAVVYRTPDRPTIESLPPPPITLLDHRSSLHPGTKSVIMVIIFVVIRSWCSTSLRIAIKSKRPVPEDDEASVKRQRKEQTENVSKDTLEGTKG